MPLQTRGYFIRQCITLSGEITSASSYSSLFASLCNDLQGPHFTGLKQKGIFELQDLVLRMLDTLHSEFNHLLITSTKYIGYDTQNEGITAVTPQWVILAESLFNDMVEQDFCNASGSLDGERLQYFLMALLLNEMRPENREQMPYLIAKQTAAMLQHFHQSQHGVSSCISQRNFKQYLLVQRLRREAELLTLKANF